MKSYDANFLALIRSCIYLHKHDNWLIFLFISYFCSSSAHYDLHTKFIHCLQVFMTSFLSCPSIDLPSCDSWAWVQEKAPSRWRSAGLSHYWNQLLHFFYCCCCHCSHFILIHNWWGFSCTPHGWFQRWRHLWSFCTSCCHYYSFVYMYGYVFFSSHSSFLLCSQWLMVVMAIKSMFWVDISGIWRSNQSLMLSLYQEGI